MTQWSLESNSFQFRVDFQFVDRKGSLLRSKTWEISREAFSPPKSYLLQCDAKLSCKKPELKKLGDNYVAVIVKVAEFTGELTVTSFEGFHDPAEISRQITEKPITFGLVVDRAGLSFSLHTTK